MDPVAERRQVERVIRASIEWAVTKDTTLLYGSFADDPALFWFSPDDAGTVRGIAAFRQQVEEIFLDPAFTAVSSEFRELDVQFSRAGDVAWYSCRLDDRNTCNGQPSNWEDVRWTGVLERREDGWKIVQMHFSYSVEAMRESQRAAQPPA
jgi:ketosteroid isomerase-like protein